MDISIAFSNINWLSVIVTSIVAFLLGWLWYSPVLFGKTWMKENNFSEDKPKESNMALLMGTAFVLQFIAVLFLDLFIKKEGNVYFGILKGLLVGAAWVVTSLGINYLFTMKSVKLFLIDAFYYIVTFTISGAILGAW